jgi:DivIVA domain-containing protein
VTNNDHHQDTAHHQAPQAIRDVTFERRLRGLDTDRVYQYLDLLADQVQGTERELSRSRAENERLHAELERVRAELDEYEQVGDRVSEQVVQLFSQAQLVAEEMVQDVSRDASERIGHAREHERRIVAEAMDAAGQQVRSYAETAQAQMQSIMDSFATEVDQLGSPSLPRDPLSDEWADWQLRFRNGDGPDSPGSD